MARVHWLVGVGLLGVLLIAAVMFLGQAEHLKPAKRISLQPSPADAVSFPPHTDRLKIAVGAIISPAQ